MFAEYYPFIKATHIGLVQASGLLFALRGVATLAGSDIGLRKSVRWISYAIDIALLGAALGLLWILHLNPITTPWLALKLAILVAYIVFGSFALKRARTRPGRLIAFGAAVFCFATMYRIARLHDPLGALWGLWTVGT